jgi:lambda family phage portal protein
MLLDATGHPLPPTRQRRFDAAGGGVRWQNAPTFGPINAEIAAAAQPVRRRGAYFSRNNPWLVNGIAALVNAIVGCGIRPTSRHSNAAMRKVLQAAWARWVARADADGITDFYGLQALAVRNTIEGGETFTVMQHGTGPGVPLRLRVLDGDMVDQAHTVELGGEARIVAGIEFDAAGNRVAYHILRRRPTDLFAGFGPPIRVPAADVLHLFQPLAPGQVRGISWLATILARLHELDQLEDAALMRQKIAAMFAGFLTDMNGTGGQQPFDGSQAGSILTSGLEPGTLKVVPSGFDIKFAQPNEAKELIDFLRLQLRAVAAGLGVPDHLVSGDLTQANYSSLRAGLVEFRSRVEAVQFGVVVHQFCRPVWERFVTLAVLTGAIEAPDFETHVEDYLAAEWYPPAQPWVDPLKDAQAEVAAIDARLKSRRQAVAERGYDIEELDAEIAADRQREEALGLAPPPQQQQKETPDAA